MAGKLRIDVWSDYVCPFCYLEEPILERVRKEYGEEVEIIWRAFELRPEPEPTLDPNGNYLQRVWKEAVYPMARARGMTLRLPPVQPRSRRALELAEMARAQGMFDEVHQAIFRAFFEDGRDLSEEAVLLEIGATGGLDPSDVRQALASGRYTEKVLADGREAADLGITGLPAMVIRRGPTTFDDATGLSGAQPFDRVKAAIEQVRQQAAPRIP
jgi:predicted DsbA family dithiol-disulfide isomerase